MSPPSLVAIQSAIQKMSGRESAHLQTVPVKETYAGRLIWEGNVEVFSLLGEGASRRCYVWADGTDGNKITVVLEVPPVVSPVTAVRSKIVKELLTKRTQKP